MSNSVYALTKDKDLSNGSLRISLSYLTTYEELDKFIEVFKKCLKNLKVFECDIYSVVCNSSIADAPSRQG